ncbi:ribonuclease II [Microbacterium mangrovi]|uniref:Ribonuclease II n=1 Tax=Microbacterium mangrovi TaxID=1348253 RepID=A0A0B1ZZR5_9MICO|nr:RNB domain-containing ribonuclease [Microbacterium mangrovi]KHK96226.1 ribonuclease II [Microbacterium mangrovi]
MPTPRHRLTASTAQTELAASLIALREELQVPEAFPPEVLAEADAARAALPATDLRDLPFATLDPPGSRDLDQAFHLEQTPRGWRVRYAIADVPSVVAPAGAVDAEARRRGQTLYAADGTVPLHPEVLSEGRASLLPGQDRSAFVWTVDLDADGADIGHRVERALVRSRVQLDYAGTQRTLDAGADSPAALLPIIGRLRIAQEQARGGASLNLPDEDIEKDPTDGYRVVRRRPLPVEDWNAQLSLLTGMAGASLMLGAGVGVLRTMPPPDDDALADFRVRVDALGRPWGAGQSYGDYLRSLDRDDPQTLAVMHAAASLFRGADYAAFDGTAPAVTVQAAVAAPYAHVTAPLRRLVDRWGLVVCEAICAGVDVPAWARESLPQVPELMRSSTQRASRLASGSRDRIEAALVRDRVGERFTAAVLGRDGSKARIQIRDPLITASCTVTDGAAPGSEIRVLLQSADIATGRVDFTEVAT